MRLYFGKHYGKAIELLVLKEADYIVWMLNNSDATGDLARARKEAKRLIRIFDQKPLIVPCSGTDCPNLATQLSAYIGRVDLVPWCDDCNPRSRGASSDKLVIVRTYQDALCHTMTSRRRRTDTRAIVKALAQAKGLPARVGEGEAEGFFEIEAVGGQRRY